MSEQVFSWCRFARKTEESGHPITPDCVMQSRNGRGLLRRTHRQMNNTINVKAFRHMLSTFVPWSTPKRARRTVRGVTT